jgi:hypothetical protein
MSTYQKPTTLGGKVAEKLVLTVFVLVVAWFLWAAFNPGYGCGGAETTASECGYEDLQ